MFIKPKVVVIGGGTGLSVMLKGLKHFPVDLTAIVSVADDGGSSGKLRDELDIPAPGDLRNVLVAFSDIGPLVEDLLQYRFKGDTSLAGHPLGNLVLAAMVGVTGDLATALEKLSDVFGIRGRILPSTCESVTLKARMRDGDVIIGESNIPKANKKIDEVFFDRSPKPVDATITAVEEADIIVLGIGSLYTSIIPNLLPKEMQEAIIRSKGRKVYICNAMEQPGETKGYTVYDHIEAIHKHVGSSFIDTVIVDKSNIPEEVLDHYKKEGVSSVKLTKKKIKSLNIEMIEAELIEIQDQVVRHNPYKTAATVYSIMDHYKG